MEARHWSSSRLSCGERLLLRCTGTPGILSRPRRERISPHEVRGGNGPLLDVGGHLCFLSSGDGYVGELFQLQQACEVPFEVPEVRCDSPGDISAEMGHISPGGENLLDTLELRQVLSTYAGTSGNLPAGLRKGQSPCELLGGLSGFLSRRFRG